MHQLAHEHVCMFLRQYTSDYKLETYLKVARLYLEDEDPVQAEAYINRASLLQAESTREDLLIHYKASNTRTHTWVICSLLSSADFVFPTSWFRCRRNLCMAWLLVTALLLFSVVLCICIWGCNWFMLEWKFCSVFWDQTRKCMATWGQFSTLE